MRVAIYYAPEPHDPLWALGCSWLGYDAGIGLPATQPDVAGLTTLCSTPRRYDFHATLKAPITLTGSLDAFESDVAELARHFSPIPLPTLQVREIHGFAALTLTHTTDEIQRLAEACVIQLDHHRLPEPPTIQARRTSRLSPGERVCLERWGYPFVLEHWQFHMTLCNRGQSHPGLLAAATTHFGAALQLPRRIESLAICIEDHPEALFRISKRIPLGA